MGLPYKTTKLIDQIADTLDDWPNENKKWNNKIIKAKPENLLSEISEGLDYIQEELRQYMPNIVQLVQERRKKLVRRVGRVYFREMESYESPRKFIISRNDATALAKTLRHVGKLAREELAAEKPAKAKPNATPAKDGKEKTTIINIKQKSKSIFGGVQQVENVQTGDQASIHKQLAKGGLLKIAKRFLDWVLKLWPK